MTNAPSSSPSDSNIVENVLPPSILAASDGSQKTFHLTKKSQSAYKAGHARKTGSDVLVGKPTKRVRLGFGKENVLEIPLRGICAATETELPSLSKALASNALGTRGRAKAKSRVGLRRL